MPIRAFLILAAGAMSAPTRATLRVRVHRPLLDARFPSCVASAAPPVRAARRIGTRRAPRMLAPAASQLVARGLGWAVSAASMSLYLPIAARIVRTGSADGLSVTTWALNVLGFAAAIVYPLRKGFPISCYFDTICLAAQSVLVLALIVGKSRSRPRTLALAAGLSAVGAAFAAAVRWAPVWGLALVQAGATTSMTVALLPQIGKNFRRRSSGGWSSTSALLSTVGNGVRVFTTATLTGDRLLLAGFSCGLLLNGILLAQTIVWEA
ncbi:hypothetical protein KFE25_011647 [Diacronema lutheri]|uniref:Solute carrier family 40 protein n=2 Tax=Diacronema lutheri TaxID=2081491 RepID=A0A8J5XJ28_DIALT|nr:hypothetical protein KFE25_011647 [Diacronema lutheri]